MGLISYQFWLFLTIVQLEIYCLTIHSTQIGVAYGKKWLWKDIHALHHLCQLYCTRHSTPGRYKYVFNFNTFYCDFIFTKWIYLIVFSWCWAFAREIFGQFGWVMFVFIDEYFSLVMEISNKMAKFSNLSKSLYWISAESMGLWWSRKLHGAILCITKRQHFSKRWSIDLCIRCGKSRIG